jgi:hypothetical protein
MGKSLANRECDWVRARLPLWADRGCLDAQTENDRSDTIGEGRDLSGHDSRVIALHLAGCEACRGHRLNLETALAALAIAAAELPAAPEAPSLWPELSRRLADAGLANRRLKAADHKRSPPRPWSALDGEGTLTRAWNRDTIGELFGSRPARRQSRLRRATGLIARLSVAAAILVVVSQLQIVNERTKDAEATIKSNQTPLPEPVTAVVPRAEPVVEIAPREKIEVPPNQLAEADIPRPAESPVAAVETGPISRPAPPSASRLGFDLDHGTPMPPDSREAKPVY